jgi:serine-type D-Ala-D-Ala carboxypeptidase (penicillin-binding protein 5/6)
MIETEARIRRVEKNISFLFIGISLIVMFCQGRPCYAVAERSQDPILDVTPARQYKNSTSSPRSCSFPKIKVNDRIVRGGLLYDMSSDSIIWQKNMYQAFPIASLTKMMVCFLALEDIHAGKVDWNTMVKVTPEATRVGGSMVSLRSGYSISVENLIKAALISSGNDAAHLLAEQLGGTEKNFVNRMNRRAVELGMKSTRFSNSTGMPACNSWDDNRSSAMDLLLLCKQIQKHDELLKVAGTSQELIYHGGRTLKLRNHNPLVAEFEEVDGLKTGFTENAKFCLAATAIKNNRRIISIALGVDNRNLRNRFVKDMLCDYFEALGMGSLQAKGCTGVKRKRTLIADNSSSPLIHQVSKGTSLFGIAKTYNCSVAQLKIWNGLNSNQIKPGQKLKIYAKTNAVPPASRQVIASSVIYYTVRPGDTLWIIAKKYTGVSVKQIMRVNNIRQARDLKVGDTLKLLPERI